MPELKVNTDRCRLRGKDVRPYVLEAAKAKWPAGQALTCSELVAWIRSDPRHPASGSWVFGLKDPRTRTPEEIAKNLIDLEYFVATA